MRYKQGKAYTPEAYSNDADYFRDVAAAYVAELKDLYDAGLRNVQFDDPGLACKSASSAKCDMQSTTTSGRKTNLRNNRFLLQVVSRRLGGRLR